MASRYYKPLLFTTTVRNPLRIKSLLYVFRKFDGQILNDTLATSIVGELIRHGLYRPTRKTLSIKQKWAGTKAGYFAKYLLTDAEVKTMIDNNPQQHGEAGFGYGYPSRFATIFDFTKELGFVYFEPNKPIEFSDIGKMMSEVLDVEIIDDQILVSEVHPENEQKVFLHAMAKSQRKNPFVKVLNDNVPLILLLQTIKLLNENPAYNGAGITRKEIPLLLFWKNNDYNSLYNRIVQLRTLYRYNPSDEVIIDICINEIMEGVYKDFDPESIMVDYTDEFIRKMRVTGLISLRGGGRFIDINHNEDEKVDYILKKYTAYHSYAYASEREYFDYMAKVDSELLTIQAVAMTASQSETLLQKWLEQYDWENIKGELSILSNHRTTSDLVLKFLPAPVRLEFLTALAIKTCLPTVRVIPNYSCDDTGLPTSTAGGNAGDIECLEDVNGILVEVTMAEGRAQTVMEVWPITRHLDTFIEKYNILSQCVFIAPTIFTDTQRQISFVKYSEDKTIRPYRIDEFIKYLETAQTLYEVIN